MKTRDRILHCSLMLFNEEGEPGTTTVDIANELDISPGNLYYHFKGKDIIIAELFNQLETGLQEILSAAIEKPLSVEDNWYYLFIVFEEIYNYRFFYHNLTDLLERYPDLKKRFRRLVQLKKDAIRAVWTILTHEAELGMTDHELEAMVNNMVIVLNFWLNYEELNNQERPPEIVIHQGVYQLMVLIAPYLGEQQRSFYLQLQDIHRSIMEPQVN
jgi:AcrR family transcriptional regulator